MFRIENMAYSPNKMILRNELLKSSIPFSHSFGWGNMHGETTMPKII